MKKKIRFYKCILLEIMETLSSICFALDRLHDGRYRGYYLGGHGLSLKHFSDTLRDEINKGDKNAKGRI